MAKLASTTVYGNLNVLETINAVNELQINNGEILTANVEAFKYKNKQVVTVDGAANTTFDINVASANKWKTARQINGTNFDGTGNITTANWGTARTLTIGSTGKSVNGSANVSWSLAELGLGNVNNTADSAKNVLSATKLTTARTIGGVSFDGTANINLPGVNTAGNQNTTGNANSATILQNTRTINGTNFNGSANITTANWGTARNIQIGNTTKSVNGSGNVSWSLSEIGAPHASGRQAATVDMNSLRATGFYGLHSGMPNASSSYGSLIVAANSDTGLQISGGHSNDHLKFRGWSSNGSSFTAWRTVYHDGYKPLADAATKLQTARTIGGVSFDGTANINLPGVNTAGNQSTSGNAATATKLQTARAINGTNFDGTASITTANWGTARTLTIGNTGKSVNGSGNVSWSTREIGALPLNTVNGCPNPAYYLSNSTSTTRTKIRLPYKSNAGKMVVFTIRVYQDYQHFDLQISGYLYSSTNQWYSPRATMISGTTSVEVKMGRDTDGYAYVSINGGNYRGVAVIDVVGGYSNADWSTGWLITATNDLANVEYTITVYPPYSPNNKPTATDVGLGNVNNTADSAKNVLSATKLTTARAINGTNFDGTGAITTANWGTARTLTIGNTGKSVNGSGNVSWSLSEIGAAASSHSHNQVNSLGNVTMQTGSTTASVSGLSMQNVYNNGYPTTYGNVLNFKGTGHGQILIGWSGTNGASAPTFIRNKRDTADAPWSSWEQVYTTAYKPTATDVGLGNVPNTVHTTAATANTVAVRDSSGDINVRLLRPNYADQSTISGAMAFRINNGSDNYIRFCNNVTNIRNWLGAAASSHTHSISQITGGTHSTITMTPNNTSGTYNTRSIELREVNNVTTGQSSDAYAPAIGWHWGGRYGKKLFMNASGRLVFDGDFSASKVYNAVWNDYAEYFPKLETTITEAGDIIALSLNDDGEFYELATEDHVMIVGAHSDQFGHIIGGENPENGESFEEYNNKKFIPVGLVGRLPVKFVGTARKGMKVVPSHIPGVGRKFDSSKDDYDKVIGYIVENNNDEGIRRVKIKIGK